MRISDRRGFTVIELMISIAVIGIIIGGVYLRNIRDTRDHASEQTCRYSRNVIVRAERNYFFRNQSHSNSFQDLADAGLIRQVPECPSGGVYTWLYPEETDGVSQPQIVCSVHGGTAGEKGDGGEEAPELPEHPDWDFQEAYLGGSFVIFGERVYQARHWTRGDEPGKISSPWQEITDQWRNFNIYHGGDKVFYDGIEYRAKWWNQNARPDISSAWEPAD